MDGSAVLLVLRATVSLVVVLGLIVWASRVVDRRLGTSRRPRPDVPVTVLTRQGLSRHASLAVVQVGEDVLVLGVTDAQVNLLTELDPAALCAHGAPDGSEGAPEPIDSVPGDAASRAPMPTATTGAGASVARRGAVDAPPELADVAAVLRSTVALPTRREVKAQGEVARTITDRFATARNTGEAS